jgi:hypothetical protein
MPSSSDLLHRINQQHATAGDLDIYGDQMNDELLALYTADRQKRIDQPRLGTPE